MKNGMGLEKGFYTWFFSNHAGGRKTQHSRTDINDPWIFVDQLDEIQFFGFPLGFWFGQQGSIFVFVGLIWAYVASMNKLDEKYDVHE